MYNTSSVYVPSSSYDFRSVLRFIIGGLDLGKSVKVSVSSRSRTSGSRLHGCRLDAIISQSCVLGWTSCSLSELRHLIWIQSFVTFASHHSTLTSSVAMAARQSGVFVRYIRPTSQLLDFCRIKSLVSVSRRRGLNVGVGMSSSWFLRFYNNCTVPSQPNNQPIKEAPYHQYDRNH